MPNDSPSLATAIPTLEASLLWVIAAVSAHQELSAQRRQDLCSAIRAVARVLGRDPGSIDAAPSALRHRLKDFTPAMAEMSPRRWRNVLSLLRAALKLAGMLEMPGRHTTPLSPSWNAMLQNLKGKRARFGLSRLASFASGRGIEPHQVDDPFSACYQAALLNDSLVRNPEAIFRRACELWNLASDTIPAWPDRRLTMPSGRPTYVLLWTAFPPSLAAEAARYLEHLGGEDVLAERDFRRLSARTVEHRDFMLRQYSSALVQRGRPPESLRSLADLVEPETVKHGLRFFLDRPHRSKRQTHGIACMLKAIARHWVEVPQRQLDQLRKFCKAVEEDRTGMTAKNRSRLRPFDDQATVRKFYALPQRMLSSIRRKKSQPNHHDALVLQTALILELLMNIPIRISNLATLDLERHLVRGHDRQKRITHIAISGSEVKNGDDIEAPLPPSVIDILALYLGKYRRLLGPGPSTWLFPGRDGGAKSIQSIRGQIQHTVASELGLRVNPHLFRHIAAKVYLDRHPGAYGLVRRVLGHKSVDSTTKSYCGMEQSAAFRNLDELISRLRGSEDAPDGPNRPTGSGCGPNNQRRSK